MAIAIALLLYAASAVPLAWAALRPAHIPAILGSMAAAIIGLIFFQSGVLQQNQLTPTAVSHLLTGDVLANRCVEVIDALVGAGVALAPPGPDGFVVNGAAWDQLPQTIQEPILLCARNLADPEAQGGEIELIRR